MPSSALPVFTGVYVFGDSLVDPGNALKAAEFIDDIPFNSLPGGAPTAEKGYFQGRFTDGWNFTDLISNKLIGQVGKTTFPYGFKDPVFGIDIPFTSRPSGNNLSFAFGGAEVIGGSPAPDLDDQTDAYRTDAGADPGALFVVTMGGNDVRELVPRNDAPITGAEAASRLQAVAAELAEEVAQLFAIGARHVLVTGIPDVGLIPHYIGSTDEAGRRALATQYSEQLDALVRTALNSLTLPAGAHLYGFDFLGLSEAFTADPTGYRLTNLTQARTVVQQGALAAVGSGFVFFDTVHPSAQIHAVAAAQVLAAMDPAAAPDAPVAAQTGAKYLGSLATTGALKTFTASLVAGQTYVFDLLGISSGSGSLADPRLRIYDHGVLVGEDDDKGLGLDAHLTFTAPTTGDYILQLSGVGVTTGSYVLQGPKLRGSDMTVEGGAAADTITAVSGANVLRGNDGNDVITGGSGFDDINGNAGNDTARGGGGNDWVVGGKDNDRLYGDAGNDLVYGNVGNDTCEGGAGNDTLRGGQGDDGLKGGDGLDWLAGDLGADTLAGGAGADVFETHGGTGLDRVTDFSRAAGDRVYVLPGTTYVASQVGADTVIDMSGGGRMVLVGVTLASLTDGWIS